MTVLGCPLRANSVHQACDEPPLFRISNEYSSAGQNNPDFGELARLRIDFNCARMLLDDDVVADGEPHAGPFSGGLRREEGVEHLAFEFRSSNNSASVVMAKP